LRGVLPGLVVFAKPAVGADRDQFVGWLGADDDGVAVTPGNAVGADLRAASKPAREPLGDAERSQALLGGSGLAQDALGCGVCIWVPADGNVRAVRAVALDCGDRQDRADGQPCEYHAPATAGALVRTGDPDGG